MDISQLAVYILPTTEFNHRKRPIQDSHGDASQPRTESTFKYTYQPTTLVTRTAVTTVRGQQLDEEGSAP